MPLRAVVAGGAGFIGSHLCEVLLDRGWEVVALDNFITGSADNVRHLAAEARFELVEVDISQSVAVAGKVSAVFNLASPASSVDFEHLPVEILEVGTAGTRNLLELAQAKQARFLLASTSEVYGDPLVHPQPESYFGNVNPIGIRGSYDESKRAGEAFTTAYRRVRGLDTRIARIFNTHGPRMRADDGRVVPSFLVRALHGEPLRVHGDGSQTRSLCYVSDLVAGLLTVFDKGDEHPYNVGSDVESSVLQIAELVLRLTGSTAAIEFTELPEDDPRRRCPDTSRLRALGWQTEVSLETGLMRTLEYFRSAS